MVFTVHLIPLHIYSVQQHFTYRLFQYPVDNELLFLSWVLGRGHHTFDDCTSSNSPITASPMQKADRYTEKAVER